MAIKYYPSRVIRAKAPVVDRLMFERKPVAVSGSANVTSNALSVVISSEVEWQVNSVNFAFSDTTPRNFNVYMINGREVVTDMNDALWIEVSGIARQSIVLAAGFYNGTQLATELQSKLNANTAFAASGITFTVAYDSATGLFTTTPSSRTIRYLDVNQQQFHSYSNSIAGHLFGLNTNGTFAATMVSDTAVFGLNATSATVTSTGSSVLSYVHETSHVLSIDQAIQLTSNTAPLVINYTVNYERLN